MGATMRLRANNLFIAVRKLISTTNLRICANKLIIWTTIRGLEILYALQWNTPRKEVAYEATD
jgi:hypothetical protein